jgi:hypothetical protein
MEPEPKQKNIETNFTELGTIPDTMSIPVPQNGMPVDGTPEANTKVIDANESNIIPDGSDSVMDKGELRSSNFSSGNAGWRILANGDVEFNNGTFRGTITGSTIYIPNATNPVFSVDAAGNVVATSLKRKDFHVFTMFESLDGYFVGVGGAGTLVTGSTGINSTTGTTSGQFNEVQKFLRDGGGDLFTWSKDRSQQTTVYMNANWNNVTLAIFSGSYGSTTTDNHIGFSMIDGRIYGTVANGTTETTLDLQSYTNNQMYVLRFDHVVGVGVQFYVNQTLKGTITTNIPTGTGGAAYILGVYHKTTTNAARQAYISYFDFWQSV